MINLTALVIDLIERGMVPDSVTRAGIRKLCSRRLQDPDLTDPRFIKTLAEGPIAYVPEKANEQHYEVPAEFFRLVLGPHLKYSCAYWNGDDSNLADAETKSLEVTCERAELDNGQRILELGCGWGSLSMWMAQQYPASHITSVSNSNSQRSFIEAKCKSLGIKNLSVITADMNDFDPGQQTFDRVVSVEMFEHMHNYAELLQRIHAWIKNDGKLFVHIFCHDQFCYPFETEGASNWMGQYFFTGGIMPSADLFEHFNQHLTVEKQYKWDGRHYEKTANAWLAKMDKHRNEILNVLVNTYGKSDASRWFRRWRIFFMACAELFGTDKGNEWYVSHYLLSPSK